MIIRHLCNNIILMLYRILKIFFKNSFKIIKIMHKLNNNIIKISMLNKYNLIKIFKIKSNIFNLVNLI